MSAWIDQFANAQFDNSQIALHNPLMLGLVLAAGAAAVTAGYQSMAPTGQWFGRAFCRSARPSKQIALTFDDGPNDPHTLNLLDVLSRHSISATFFLIGKYVKRRPDLVVEVAKRGHVIGNHTLTHPYLTFESAARIRDQIVQCRDAIEDAVGEHSNLFRPPWGARRPAVFRIVRELGLDPIMWSVTGYDWNAPSADYIEQKVTSRIHGGDVVLLHDGGHAQFGADRSATVAVVDRLLSRYKAGGYEFVTIPAMMPSLTGSPSR
jgi:peptidoglycan/xylan/chitin deacetylase (PgdA/CDA1 family)